MAALKICTLISLLLFSLSGHTKMFVRKIHTIEAEPTFRYDQRWMRIAPTEEAAIKELVKILKTSPTGKKILAMATKKARTEGNTLFDILKAGEGSITDTTLVRKFSPSQPDVVTYESRSKVYINRHLTVKNALLDTAHELTHYALRDPFNPYQAPFGLKDFITSTVEGKGGEVEAYLVECRVLLELFPKKNHSSNCHRVVDPHTGKVDKGRGIQQFYQLGRYYSTFVNSLKKHEIPKTAFSGTSEKGAHFISSAYGLPYPLAAVHEYEAIMKKVCQNDDRRLSLMRQSLSRSPSSVEKKRYRHLASVHENRCQGHLTAYTSN